MTVEDREILDHPQHRSGGSTPWCAHSLAGLFRLCGSRTTAEYQQFMSSGDFDVLVECDRRALRAHLGTNVATGLSTLRSSFHWALLQITLRTFKIMCISMLRVVAPYVARVDISADDVQMAVPFLGGLHMSDDAPRWASFSSAFSIVLSLASDRIAELGCAAVGEDPKAFVDRGGLRRLETEAADAAIRRVREAFRSQTA